MPASRSKAAPFARYALGLWFLGIAALGFVRFFMKAFADDSFQATIDAWLWLAGSVVMVIAGVFAIALEARKSPPTR